MASISVGGHTARKSLDSAVPLIPMIDLLLCCVMFLLVTAVWNQLASISASQRLPGAASIDTAAELRDEVVLAIHAGGYELSSLAGDRQVIDAAHRGELAQLLRAFRELHRNSPLTIATDDGVAYDELVRALDHARGAGFEQIDVAAGDAAR